MVDATRRRLLALAIALHGLGAFAAAVQSVLFQLSSKTVHWGDVALFGGVFLGLGALVCICAVKVGRGSRGWTTGAGVVAGLLGSVELVVGVWAVTAALSGPTDGYVGPIGGLAIGLGLVHLSMTLASLLNGSMPTHSRD